MDRVCRKKIKVSINLIDWSSPNEFVNPPMRARGVGWSAPIGQHRSADVDWSRDVTRRHKRNTSHGLTRFEMIIGIYCRVKSIAIVVSYLRRDVAEIRRRIRRARFPRDERRGDSPARLMEIARLPDSGTEL